MAKSRRTLPGSGAKSGATLKRRQRAAALWAFARRHAPLVLVAALAWAAKAAWPRAKAVLFPRKTSSRRGKKTDAAAERGAEWAVLLARADALVSKGSLAEGVAVYQEAIRVAPKLSPAHTNLCAAYLQQGDLAEALQSCKLGHDLAKDDAERSAALLNYGIAHKRGFGAAGVNTALEAWRRAAQLDDASVPPRRYLAVVAAQAGRLREAAEAEKAAFLLAPRPESLVHFAQLALARDGAAGGPVGADLLKTGFGDPASLDGFQDQLVGYAAAARAQDAPPDGLAKLLHAKFLYADFQKDRPGAWTALTEANAARRAATPADLLDRNSAASSKEAAAHVVDAFPGGVERKARRERRLLAEADLLAEIAGPEAAAAAAADEAAARAAKARPEPTPGATNLFLVGAPRTGATLLHAALGRHPAIAADGEDHRLWGDIVAEAGLAFFSAATEVELEDVGRNYRAALASRHGGRDVVANASYVVDADLENVWWLGAADAALAGDLKAIVVRRDPKAVAFSCYKTPFPPGRPWADDPADLAGRLAAIRKLEDHFLSTLPADSIRVVQYEDLIANPEAALTDVFQWLNVSTDCPLCLKPNETEALMTSPGRIEVRAPAFHAEGLKGWEAYEPFLEAEVWPQLAAAELV